MDADLEYKLIFTAVSSIGGIIAAIAIAYGKMLIDLKFNREKNKQDRKRTDSPFMVYSDLVDQTYEHLLHIQSLGAARSLVLCTRNGGGIPRFDKPLRVSILREVYAAGVESVKSVFQDVETDHAYDDVLRSLLKSEDGKITLVTSDMKEGMLKNNYERSGVTLAHVYYLNETDKRLFYASFNFISKDVGFEHEHDCDMEAKALKRIFKQIEDVD